MFIKYYKGVEETNISLND